MEDIVSFILWTWFLLFLFTVLGFLVVVTLSTYYSVLSDRQRLRAAIQEAESKRPRRMGE